MVGLGSPTFQNITAPSSSYIEWKYKRLNYMKNIFSGPDFVHSTIFIHTPLNIQLASQPSESSVIFFFTLLVPFLGFLFFFKTTKQQQRSHNNNHAPLSHPIIGCLVSFYQNRHRLLDWYTEQLANSPTQTIVVRRLGARRTVVTANPRNVEYILKTNFGNFPKGKPFTEILGDFLGCGIFNVDGELWHTQRKLASNAFSTRSLKDFIVKTLQEEVQQRLVPLLEHAARENHVIDLQDVLSRLTFDTVCKVSLGYDPCCLDLSKPLPPLLTAFDTASEVSAARGSAPVFLVWKMKRMLNVGSEKALKEAVKLVHESVMNIIKLKKEEIRFNRKNGTDLLDRLLEACHEEIVVRDMVISMIMAGRDTTSAAMTWLFWLLSRHREQEASLVKEVYDENNQNQGLGLDYECLKEMKLLKACLCESMRLYPPVAWDSKHAGGADVLPDGTHVEKGDRVTYFPYGMGRMEALWGENCCEFKPQRWFHEENVDNGILKCVNPYMFPVFQAGPRVCLGREMAFIQMKYVVASILNRFVISPVSDEQPRFVPLLTAHMAGGFIVRVHKRNGTEIEK
ncbi:Cytochrome P450 94B3 [Glycine max]|nr:Cytochrome P450 94B3 [Glycine max]